MHLAIVGGGPAGLVAALAARRSGIEATVFEQARDFRRVGGGIALHSNGLRVLEALGVLPMLGPRMRPFRTMTIERVGSGPLASIDVGALDVPHNRVAILARYELQQALLEAVIAAGVPVSFERRCEGAAWEAGRVALRFSTGIERGFDAVVAADGIHSRLRASAALSCRQRSLGWASLRGVVELPHAVDSVRELWGADGRIFGIAPLPGTHAYFYCTAPFGGWGEMVSQGRVAEWIDSWRAYGPEVSELLRAVSDWQRVVYDEIGEVRVRRWYRTPLFLVGDAAHAMAPNLGQGANSAMVDALLLVHLLADAERAGSGVDGVGPRYQKLRRRFVTRVQSTSRWAGVFPQWRSPALRFAVDAMLRVQDRLPWFKRRATLLGVGHNPSEEQYLE
jgi:2-polyprenyl-6-methoxyphenol hydroxylase-like FAD-dependent oxidoreductase